MKWLLCIAGFVIASNGWGAPRAKIAFVYGEKVSEFKFSDDKKGVVVDFGNSDGKTGKREFVGNDAKFVRDKLSKFEKSLPSESRFCNRKEILFTTSGTKSETKRVCLDLVDSARGDLIRFVDLLATYF